MRHDSFIYVPWLPHMCAMTQFICALWLISCVCHDSQASSADSSPMTHSYETWLFPYMCRDSLICVPWLIFHMCAMTHKKCWPSLYIYIYVYIYIYIYIYIYDYVYMYIYVPWPMHMRHDSFIYVPWLPHTCAMTQFICASWLISCVWHDSQASSTDSSPVIIFICDMTLSIRDSWLPHMCAMTHSSYVCHDSFHKCYMTRRHHQRTRVPLV